MIKKARKWTAENKWIFLVAFLILLNLVLFVKNVTIHYEGIIFFFSKFTPEKITGFVKSFGILAPVVIVLIHIVESIFAPIPGHVVTIAAGSLYGPFWGTLLSAFGIIIGSIFPFYISRIFGRPVVEKLVNPKHLKKADAFFNKNRGMFVFMLIRLLPIATFDVISYSAGLTKMSFPKYLLVTAVATFPGVIIYTNIGYLLFKGSTAALAILIALTIFGSASFFIGLWLANRFIEKKQEAKQLSGEDY